jgi:hypothetical protein
VPSNEKENQHQWEEPMNNTPEESSRTAHAVDDHTVSTTLKEIVRDFHVRWEVLPDCYPVKNELRQIGFYLELTGDHESGVENPQPGCEHCRKVWIGLKEIADWILPKEERDTDYDIAPYDQSIHYDASRKFQPEVSLRIWIRHRSGFDREVDACEVRCLKEMTQRLVDIGARKGKWSSD